MSPISLVSFRNEIENILVRSVKLNYPEDWDEDFMTRGILKDIRRTLRDVRLEGLRENLHIYWNAWKLSGKAEHKYGDVAVLVTIRDRTGDQLRGAAFLEAKKRSNRRHMFGSLDFEQVERIYASAPHAMVLLYDYKPITEFVLNRDSSSRLNDVLFSGSPAPDAGVPYTHAVAVPMSHVRALGRRDVSLYKYSVPFSYQLLHRYLQGFDLEFHDEAVTIALGQSTEAAPRYLLHVYIGRDADVADVGEAREDVPDDRYARINEGAV